MSQPNPENKALKGEIENRKISDRGKELAQYVRDLYTSGAKLWTKDMFHEIEAELAKQPRPHALSIRSMNGVLRSKQIPLEEQEFDIRPLRVIPRFKCYQTLVHDAEKESLEFDPDDGINRYMNSDMDDDKALATRALSLARQYEATPTTAIDYVVLKAAWDEAQRNWKQSSVCRELIAVLGNSHIPKTTNKLVCFGLGTFELGIDGIASCDRLPLRHSMTQHSAALTVAAVLAERLGTAPLPILAQDPNYSLATKRLLVEAGIEVPESYGTLAFTYVDESTLVFSCSPNIPVKQVVADIAKPAAMIWNRVKPAAEEKTEFYTRMINDEEVLCTPWSTDEDSPRTRRLVEDYNKFEFPAERDRFGDLEMFIRRE